MIAIGRVDLFLGWLIYLHFVVHFVESDSAGIPGRCRGLTRRHKDTEMPLFVNSVSSVVAETGFK